MESKEATTLLKAYCIMSNYLPQPDITTEKFVEAINIVLIRNQELEAQNALLQKETAARK